MRDYHVVTCAYCRTQMDVEVAAYHQCDPAGAVVISVRNLKAVLGRMQPAGGGMLVFQPFDVQPPEELLEEALWEAGGAINISGIYPVSDEVLEWMEEEGIA